MAFELHVDDKRVRSFGKTTVKQFMPAFASSIEVEYENEFDDHGRRVVIETGDPIRVREDDDDVFEGYIDRRQHKYTARSEIFKAYGRSRLGDFLDCDVVGKQRFRDARILDIVNEVTDGYGVPILFRGAETEARLRRFDVNVGETVAACILRAIRERGLVAIDEGGVLSIDRAGQQFSRTKLKYGVNILRGEMNDSWLERFSEYTFRGQTRATDEEYGADIRRSHKVEDPQINRLRRKAIHVHGAARADQGVRAINERNRRAGRGEQYVYQVGDRRDEQGQLWAVNQRVDVEDARFEINKTLLIIGVTNARSAKMDRTDLILTNPEAYDVVVDLPVRPRRGSTS